MKKYLIGSLIGLVAGGLQCLFLLFADVEITVWISIVITWIVIGLLISTVDFKVNSPLKGMIVSLLVSLPSLIYTISTTMVGAIYTFITTLILGALLGYLIEKATKS